MHILYILIVLVVMGIVGPKVDSVVRRIGTLTERFLSDLESNLEQLPKFWVEAKIEVYGYDRRLVIQEIFDALAFNTYIVDQIRREDEFRRRRE